VFFRAITDHDTPDLPYLTVEAPRWIDGKEAARSALGSSNVALLDLVPANEWEHNRSAYTLTVRAVDDFSMAPAFSRVAESCLSHPVRPNGVEPSYEVAALRALLAYSYDPHLQIAIDDRRPSPFEKHPSVEEWIERVISGKTSAVTAVLAMEAYAGPLVQPERAA
jgi:hypothetical protein